MQSKRLHVVFQGETYYLDARDGYFKTSRSRGNRLLHRDIWAATNGAIPDAWQVHHKISRGINDPGALECLSRSDHTKEHPRTREPWTVHCRLCGAPFQTAAYVAKYCSPAHREKARRERINQHR